VHVIDPIDAAPIIVLSLADLAVPVGVWQALPAEWRAGGAAALPGTSQA